MEKIARSARVLLFFSDTDVAIPQLIHDVLAPSYQVTLATSTDEFLESLASIHPDLLLVGMPDIDPETLASFKALLEKAAGTVPRAALVTDRDRSGQVNALFDAVISEPFSIYTLTDVVARLARPMSVERETA